MFMQIIPRVRFRYRSPSGDDTENKLQSSCYFRENESPCLSRIWTVREQSASKPADFSKPV